MDAIIVTVPEFEAARLATAPGVREIIQAAESAPERRLDLEDDWAALHFLLSGEVPIPEPEAHRRGLSWDEDSLENVIMGGQSTPYMGSLGPARYLSPERVAHLADRLAEVPTDEVVERYDPEALESEDIPIGGEDEDEIRERLRTRYEALSAHFRTAATRSDGLLVYFV